MKCAYKTCKFDNQIEKGKEIKYKNRYYHLECLKEVQNKEEIRKIYFEHINPSEVVKMVNLAISKLINEKKVDSEYLLFVIKYIVNHKMKVNYPMGLYYYVNNSKIKEAWNLLTVKQQKIEMTIETNNPEISFEYKPQTNNQWNNILR